MSRIGNKPVNLPHGVTIKVDSANVVSVKGPLGELKQKVDKDITVTVEGNSVIFTRPTEQPRHRSMHGLGRNLHESPEVPNYGRRGQGPMLKNGLVICIEPMINLGKRQIFQEKDGWTIRTQDGKPSAHFELAVAVKNGKADVLSTFKFIDEFLERKA